MFLNELFRTLSSSLSYLQNFFSIIQEFKVSPKERGWFPPPGVKRLLVYTGVIFYTSKYTYVYV